MIGNKMVTEHFESFQQLVGSVSEWRLYEDLRILRILWVNERWKAPVSNYLGKRLIRLSVWFWFWNLLPVLPWVYLVIGHLRQESEESEVTMENGELGDKVWKQLLWPDNWCLLVKALFTRQRKIPLWLEFCLAFKDENRFSLEFSPNFGLLLADCPAMSFVFVYWHSRKWWPSIRGGTL